MMGIGEVFEVVYAVVGTVIAVIICVIPWIVSFALVKWAFHYLGIF